MKKKRIMKITFEGQSHQIDANTLINVLIHYQTVITEANKELGGGSKSIELRVNAIEKGSFIIDISMIESIKDVFTGECMEYLANLTAVVSGVYAAYHKLKGNPAKTEADKESIQINNAKDSTSIIINNSVVNVYNNKLTREAISKSIETADADPNVEGLKIDLGNGQPSTFPKSSFKEYIYDNFDEEDELPTDKIEIVDANLVIIGLNFEPGSKWKFMYNGFTISMNVRNDALMKKIDEGERFGKGDLIHVKMKINKRYNPKLRAYENKSFKIVEFLDHITAPKQQDLF